MEIENNANILLLFFPYIFANDTNARTYVRGSLQCYDRKVREGRGGAINFRFLIKKIKGCGEQN